MSADGADTTDKVAELEESIAGLLKMAEATQREINAIENSIPADQEPSS